MSRRTAPIPEDGETCAKCDYVHDPKKCQSHVVKDPETRLPIPPRQCAKWPVKGSRTCTSHGAARGSKSRPAADQRAAEAKAEKQAAKMWAKLGSAEAVTDPQAAMADLAGSLQAMVDEAGRRVNEIGHLAGGEHLSQLRAEVVLLDRLLGRYHATLDALGRFDYSGRQLALAEQEARINRQIADTVTAAVTGALGVLFGVRSELLPEDRALFLGEFTKRLGVVETPALPPAPTDEKDPAAVPASGGEAAVRAAETEEA